MARAVQGRGHDGHCVLALARARGQSFRWLMAARVEAVARARGGFGVGGRTTSSSTENGGKACSSRMNFLCEAAASWGSTRLALCFAQLAFSVNALSPPRRHPTTRRSHAYDHVTGTRDDDNDDPNTNDAQTRCRSVRRRIGATQGLPVPGGTAHGECAGNHTKRLQARFAFQVSGSAPSSIRSRSFFREMGR